MGYLSSIRRKENMDIIAAILQNSCAVAVFLLTLSSNPAAGINWTTCETRNSMDCNCTSAVLINVLARCQFRHVSDLKFITATRDVVRLNLSWNNIQQIPSKSFPSYSNLIYLSLSSNNITDISEGAFTGLAKLRELNLQDNLIKQWDTKLILHELPNLAVLNVAQNVYWKPDQQVLSLPHLKIIDLLLMNNPQSTWQLFKCYLVRKNITKTLENTSMENISTSISEKVTPNALLLKQDNCWQNTFFFRDTSYWTIIDTTGFYPHCKGLWPYPEALQSISKRHFSHMQQQNSWYFMLDSETPYCWDSIARIHILTLIEGIGAMILNLFAIIITLRSRVLRESAAHILVANTAVGDLFVAFYIIIVASTRQIMDENQYSEFYVKEYCKVVGSFYLVGQISSPLMSFMMTLERYLAVVYCMRPHIRITKTMCYVAMAILWGLSISLAVSFMTSPKFSNRTDSMCIPLKNTNDISVLQYTGGIGILLYLLAIALYGHLYFDFQKTNQKSVQLQRENRTARRIALIMFTNVFFFILPLISILIVINLGEYISYVHRYIFSKTFAFVFFGCNCCLNPILFSFRNETFRAESRRRCPVFRKVVGPKP